MTFYWLEMKLSRSDTLIEQTNTTLTVQTVVQRSKGERVKMFDRTWIVTDCYPV